ncbi:MAG: hypothetical protein WC023_08100 [Rhodocyclaceae bacterium]
MAFWEGVKKIFSGIEDIAATPSEIYSDLKRKRRAALSGKYTVQIPAEYGRQGLVAHITFNGDCNMHDIDLLTYAGGTVDVWDELPDDAKDHVNRKITYFLYDLMKKHSASPYH